MRKAIYLILILAVTGCTNYSEGDRTGTITKLSNKGMIFKTWEGELLMGGLKKNSEGASAANVFPFSVDAESKRGENIQGIVDTLLRAMDLGLPVKIHYNEEVFTDWNLSRGNTSHYVTKVSILRE